MLAFHLNCIKKKGGEKWNKFQEQLFLLFQMAFIQ